MADTPKVYVMCDANCRWESMTKEQILTAIAQAVNDGEITNLDTGFITTVKTINDIGLKFFVGEQHEYNALTDEQKENLFAIVTNDTVKEGLYSYLDQLNDAIALLNAIVFPWDMGEAAVYKAMQADKATKAEKAEKVSPIVHKTISYNDYDVPCTLDENSVYLVAVSMNNKVVSTFTLAIGSLSNQNKWVSTVGSDIENEQYIYKGRYTKSNNGTVFSLSRATLNTSGGMAFIAINSSAQIVFSKIADYPT